MTVSQSPDHLANILSPHLDVDRLTERLQRLVRTPSENPPGNEAEAAEVVASMCDESGLTVSSVEVEAGRPSILATLGSGESPHVVFCSHIDVVPAGDPSLWDRDPYSGDIEAGMLFGRGSGDAKGPVAAGIEAAAAVAASDLEPAGTLTLALVADEEAMGFKGAGPLVSQGVVPAEIAIVGEPTSLKVVRAQRGACWFRVTVTGRAAHGSAPERGRSAILHMAEIVSHIPSSLPDIRHDVLGGPSINVGTISGGEKVNIVPASCVIEVDRRSLPGESEDDLMAGIESAVQRARHRYPDLEASVELQFYGKPFEIDQDAPLVQVMSAAVAEAQGAPAELVGFRGASDARFFAEAGAGVIVCGPGDIRLAHTAGEHVELAEVQRAARAYSIAFALLVGA